MVCKQVVPQWSTQQQQLLHRQQASDAGTPEGNHQQQQHHNSDVINLAVKGTLNDGFAQHVDGRQPVQCAEPGLRDGADESMAHRGYSVSLPSSSAPLPAAEPASYRAALMCGDRMHAGRVLASSNGSGVHGLDARPAQSSCGNKELAMRAMQSLAQLLG
jgi:hypothetical protein